MLVILAGILTFAALAAFYTCTNKIDEHWRNRTPRPTRNHPTTIPPFIHSETQCRKCGLDGQLLTIDTHYCWVCHERTHTNA